MIFRLLPYAMADGPHNMAADETLLESAAVGVASLRFYGWSEPTVSLGYFQREAVRREDPQLVRLAFVRRPSGGATLVHHHEVTYALALPVGSQGSEPWLGRMHRIIGEALTSLGVPARSVDQAVEQAVQATLCFQQPTAGDLLIGASKVVGSAQRRQRGALLQHGAILFARSPHALVLPGIRELSGRMLRTEDVCAAILHAFVRQTGWEAVPGDWTLAECSRVEALAIGKYAHDAWNRKR
jgi:lipoyl(octanoyl) transferase